MSWGKTHQNPMGNKLKMFVTGKPGSLCCFKGVKHKHSLAHIEIKKAGSIAYYSKKECKTWIRNLQN